MDCLGLNTKTIEKKLFPFFKMSYVGGWVDWLFDLMGLGRKQ